MTADAVKELEAEGATGATSLEDFAVRLEKPRTTERGPFFIHAEPCSGYLTPDRYPPALSHRQQVTSAYDQDGRIAEGILVNDGEHAVTVIRELLARPDVTLVHLRNVALDAITSLSGAAEAHHRRPAIPITNTGRFGCDRAW